VHAKDPDGDGVTYAITGGNEDSNFELDNQKGEYSQVGCKLKTSFEYIRSYQKNEFPLPVCSTLFSSIIQLTFVVFWGKTNTPCVAFDLQLLFCVCVHLCVNVMFVCIQACLPDCVLSVSRLHLSAVFAFRLFISTFYA